ncbi:hypothetical protein BDV41DRAFT_573336 [Aspergillus transmontanensis]|uniref:SPT2 chromatin protein-domain-containing protein n=1 Tax=Aspergillus transmontanensis TaxID=1034304 RepID=A0A5N6W7J2_9EURO|nr:hypothetical protein BDV41DRAFT_573336 [Aspergillus transmontanensis]
MSFLDSVLSSIETGKPSPLPPVTTTQSAPVSSSTAKSEARRSSTTPRDVTERTSNAAGTKRKAEELLQRPQKPLTQTSSKQPLSRPMAAAAAPKPRPITTPAAKPAIKSSISTSSASQKAAPVSSKPPPKGSFAEIMAKAKELQQKAPTQAGMFKHQAVPKEKLSKMERKKRAMEAQAKEKDARSAKKPGATFGPTTGSKAGGVKPARKREPEELSYKGTARPTPSAAPEYRGTAGLPARSNPIDRKAQARSSKRSRMDEYLGTDEEDEGEYADDYDDFSDASSDMEGGFNDVEEEEAAALAAARKEDEEEWRAELAAKQAKLERQRKLSTLASRRR